MEYLALDKIRIDEELQTRLPPPPPQEFERLLADIRIRGILVDLLLTRDGLLLDGHRRYLAAKELGLKEAPVKRLPVDGVKGWESAFAIAVNLNRRHLNEAQRADLGSSLLRLEKVKAKERQREGRRLGGQVHREPKELLPGNRSPQATDDNRATSRVADAVGVSRKTLERVEKVKGLSPEVAKRMLDGGISVAAAYDQVAEGRAGAAESQDFFSNLRQHYGKYRTVYIDIPAFLDLPQYNQRCLVNLPARELAHKDGCHFWIWASWELLRQGILQRLLQRWKLAWIREVILSQQQANLAPQTLAELLLLCASGRPSLLSDDLPNHMNVGSCGLSRPLFFYELMENNCLGPRLELLLASERSGWESWKPMR